MDKLLQCLNTNQILESRGKKRRVAVCLSLILEKGCFVRFQSRCLLYWDLLMVYFTVFIAFIIPISLVRYTKELESLFIEIISLFEICILVDILLKFRTTILDREGQEIFNSKFIALRYVKGGTFFVDVFSFFTFYAVFVHQVNLKYFILTKLLQLHRIPKLIKQMNMTEQCKYLWKFLFLTMGLLMFYNVAAFIVFISVHYQSKWIPPVDLRDPSLYDYFNEPWSTQYLVAFYYAGILMNGGNISPINTVELASASFLMLAGQILHANVFGQMAMYINNIKMKESRMNELMDRVVTTMKNIGIGADIQLRVRNFLLSTSSTQMQQQQFNTFLNMISPSLRDIVREQLYFKALSHNPIIRQISFEKMEHRISFNRFLSHSMDVTLTSPEDTVIEYQDEAKAMYFIVRGSCRVLQRRAKFLGFVAFRTLRESDHFGELGLIFDTKRSAKVICEKYCTIANLSKDHFRKIVSEVPSLHKLLIRYCLGYKDKLKRTLTNILPYVRYFRDLPKLDLLQIIYNFRVELFKEGESLHKVGEESEYLMVVISGFLVAYIQVDGIDVPLTILHKGHVINFDAMVCPYRVQVSFRVEKDASIALLHRNSLLKFVEENHHVRNNYHIVEKQIEESELRPYPLDIYYVSKVQGARRARELALKTKYTGKGHRDALFKFKNAVIRILNQRRQFQKRFSLKEQIIAQLQKEKLQSLMKQATMINRKSIVRTLTNSFPDVDGNGASQTPMSFTYLYKVTSKITQASKFESFIGEHLKLSKTIKRLLLILKQHSKLLLFLQNVFEAILKFNRENQLTIEGDAPLQMLQEQLSGRQKSGKSFIDFEQQSEVFPFEQPEEEEQKLQDEIKNNVIIQSLLQEQPKQKDMTTRSTFDQTIKEEEKNNEIEQENIIETKTPVFLEDLPHLMQQCQEVLNQAQSGLNCPENQLSKESDKYSDAVQDQPTKKKRSIKIYPLQPKSSLQLLELPKGVQNGKQLKENKSFKLQRKQLVTPAQKVQRVKKFGFEKNKETEQK